MEDTPSRLLVAIVKHNTAFMTSEYSININVFGFKYYSHFMKQFEVACLRCMSVRELEVDSRYQGFCL